MATQCTSGLPFLTLLAATIAVAGCQSNLDMEKLTASIKSGLTEQLQMPFSSVSCPEARPIKNGDVFECKAMAETGGDLTVSVTQSDAGNVNWKLTNGEKVLSLTSLEKQITDELARQLKVEASVDCGGKMRISEPGKIFECTANAGSERRQVAVTMKDERGNVNWAMK